MENFRLIGALLSPFTMDLKKTPKSKSNFAQNYILIVAYTLLQDYLAQFSYNFHQTLNCVKLKH